LRQRERQKKWKRKAKNRAKRHTIPHIYTARSVDTPGRFRLLRYSEEKSSRLSAVVIHQVRNLDLVSPFKCIAQRWFTCVCARAHTRVKCVQACVYAVSTVDWKSRYTCPATHAHAHRHCTRTHTFSPACQGILYSSPLHQEYDPRLPHWQSFKERCVSVNIRYVHMMHFCMPRGSRPPHKLPHYWLSDLPMLSSPVRNQVEKRNIRELFPFLLVHTQKF
jgi:hypothetical protein